MILNPDQMRADSMAHLGNPASVTPNLDALAQEGISFSRAFCQNPVCTPSRCSFMSGWYPHVHGHRTMTHMMHPGEPVLLEQLKNAGYQVWMNQRNDLLPAQTPGYEKNYCTTYFTLDHLPASLADRDTRWRGSEDGDNYYSFFRGSAPEGDDVDTLWTDGAVEFIRSYDSEQPFCLFLPWMNPHPAYQAEETYLERIDPANLPPRIRLDPDFAGKPRMEKKLHEMQRLENWTEERFDRLRATYLAMCSKVDDMTGQVLDALKEKGFYDNTAVFFFSDHGDFTGDYGIVEKAQNCFEDCLTNVPFLVKLPKRMQTRTGIDNSLVELIDFYATAAELGRVKQTHTHFGISLTDYLAGRTDTVRKEVFCEGGILKGESHCYEAGGQQGPQTQSLYYPRQYLQSREYPYNGKGIMCRTETWKYVARLYEPDELYDLQEDPQELRNLAEDPACREIALDMKQRILMHYMRTCDVVPFEKDQRMDFRPFLKGKSETDKQ